MLQHGCNCLNLQTGHGRCVPSDNAAFNALHAHLTGDARIVAGPVLYPEWETNARLVRHGNPRDFHRIDQTEAVDHIRTLDDTTLLNRWINTERRPFVRAALETRLTTFQPDGDRTDANIDARPDGDGDDPLLAGQPRLRRQIRELRELDGDLQRKRCFDLRNTASSKSRTNIGPHLVILQEISAGRVNTVTRKEYLDGIGLDDDHIRDLHQELFPATQHPISCADIDTALDFLNVETLTRQVVNEHRKVTPVAGHYALTHPHLDRHPKVKTVLVAASGIRISDTELATLAAGHHATLVKAVQPRRRVSALIAHLTIDAECAEALSDVVHDINLDSFDDMVPFAGVVNVGALAHLISNKNVDITQAGILMAVRTAGVHTQLASNPATQHKATAAIVQKLPGTIGPACSNRYSKAVAKHAIDWMAEQFGGRQAAWELFVRLADNWAGSGEELVDTIAALTAGNVDDNHTEHATHQHQNVPNGSTTGC